MAFKQIERVKIDGSPRIFGGTIYNMSFNRQIGIEPFTLSVDIVSSKGEYSVNDSHLQYNTPYNITIGDLSLNMYLDGYFPQNNSGQRVMRLEFIDTSIILDSIFIGLPNVHLDPNVSSNKILLVKDSNGNFVTKQQLELQKLFSNMVLQYDLHLNLIGNQSALKYHDLVYKQYEYIPDYVYNIEMLINTITSAGIMVDTNNIDLTKYSKYYINHTGTIRSVLSSCLQEFGLSFFWFNEQIVLIDLAHDITATQVRDYIANLQFKDVSGYSESVSIRNNVNRISSTSYRQEGGEYIIPKVNRRRKFFRIDPEDLGVNNGGGYFTIYSQPSTYPSTKHLRFASQAAKDKYIIRKAHTLWKNNDTFSAFAGTSDGNRFQYFYYYDAVTPTIPELATIKAMLRNITDWPFDANETVIHNLRKVDNPPAILDENYMDLFGRFYARKGRLKDKFDDAKFYYSEQKVYETPLKDFFKGDSPKLELSIKQLFASNLNLTLSSNPSSHIYKGRQTQTQNLHGVWIKELDRGQRWKYQKSANDPIVTGATIKELFENSFDISQAIDNIEKGCVFKPELTNKGNFNGIALDSPYLIHKNLYDPNENCLVSQIVDKTYYEAIAPDYVFVHSEGNLENSERSYSHKEISKQYGEINNSDKTKVEVNVFEVVPEDVFIEYGVVEQEVPPALTVSSQYTNDQILNTAQNYAQEAAFKQNSPNVEISFTTSTINQLTLSKTLFMYLKSFNLSMDENGYKMDYVFGNNVKQLVNPEVYKQMKYWTVRSIYGATRWNIATRPIRTDYEPVPISYPDGLLGNYI